MARNIPDPLDTVRLSSRERRRLVEQLNQLRYRPVLESERRGARLPYCPMAGVVVAVTHPAGITVRFSVLPRNLSSGGLAFLHGQFLYPRSRAGITLPTLDGRLINRRGHVVACNLVGGKMHEVRTVFDETIDLHEFIELSEHAPQTRCVTAPPQQPAEQPARRGTPEDHARRVLAKRFLGELGGFVTRLRIANDQGDFDTLRGLCRQLEQTGGTVGLSQIHVLAGLAGEQLDKETLDLRHINDAVGQLLETCRQALR